MKPRPLVYIVAAPTFAFQQGIPTQCEQMGRIHSNLIKCFVPPYGSEAYRSTPKAMKPSANNENDINIMNSERRKTSLSVSSLESMVSWRDRQYPPSLSDLSDANHVETITKVLSASLLVTGNTVGSSIFVLPEAIREIGMVWGCIICLCLYLYNLISGLLLADVAIKLHESTDCEVPSSLKDFADVTMKDNTTGVVIGVLSLLFNSCFLSYGLVRAGSLIVCSIPSLGLDMPTSITSFAVLMAVAASTQSNEGLERIANGAVMILFLCFAFILLPSLVQMHDPIATLFTPGTQSEGFIAAAATATPLLLSNLIYQNIVPSVTKLLKFDRIKSTIAIALGSFIPLGMYITWCFAALGGGFDSALSGTNSVIFTAFAASALIGSTVACIMSLAEEYESILGNISAEESPCPLQETFSTPAVVMSIAPPTAIAVIVSGGGDLEFTAALHFAGAFLSPFLYGVLPILLHQRVKIQNTDADSASNWNSFAPVLLGAGTLGLFGCEVVQ